MIEATLNKIHCPACQSSLELHTTRKVRLGGFEDIQSGTLSCTQCDQVYPILGGVPILVVDVESYLLHHVKGISRFVQDRDFPEEYRDAMFEARSELEVEHIEEDLESERVNALYLATHFLKSKDPAIRQGWLGNLIQTHWDQGPFSVISQWAFESKQNYAAVEYGCGVGGLALALGKNLSSYLGVDSSFASISLARKWVVGRAGSVEFKIPGDLLQGFATQQVQIEVNALDSQVDCDFVVADVETSAVRQGSSDLCLSLNTIDMLGDPMSLPKIQWDTLCPGGIAIQSSPYVWHELQARMLRSIAPKDQMDSASCVEWMYSKCGFQLEKSVRETPWLFFKHLRQLEIYCVHMLWAKKP